MKSGTREEAEGKLQQVQGKIKEVARKNSENVGECFWHLRKGAGHALDHICDSLNSVGAGIVDRLHDGRRHSCPAGHRHRRGGDPGYSGTTSVTI
jgi:hypothetical protein